MADIPWITRRDVNLGTNEFVNQFTLNRNFNKLLENDIYIQNYINDIVSTSVSAIYDDVMEDLNPDTEYIKLTGYDDGVIPNDEVEWNSTASVMEWDLSEFEGDGINISEIRHVYIEAEVCVNASIGSQHAIIYAWYPSDDYGVSDDNRMSLLSSIASSSSTDVATTIKLICIVPVNSDQSTIKLEIDVDFHNDQERAEYTIIGVSQRII